jgi:inner membrane protein
MVPAGLAAVLFQADPLLTLTAALAGLAPDIDEPWSVIGQRFWFLAWWVKYVVGHRTLSHSLLMVFMVGIGGLLLLVPPAFVGAICLGWLTHIVLDALSGGVLLWWPSKERWVLGRHPVYGMLDRVLLVSGMLLAVGMMLLRVQMETKSLHSDTPKATIQRSE